MNIKKIENHLLQAPQKCATLEVFIFVEYSKTPFAKAEGCFSSTNNFIQDELYDLIRTTKT